MGRLTCHHEDHGSVHERAPNLVSAEQICSMLDLVDPAHACYHEHSEFRGVFLAPFAFSVGSPAEPGITFRYCQAIDILAAPYGNCPWPNYPLQSNYLAAPPCQRPDSAQSRFRAPAEGLQASKEPFIRCGTHRLEQPKSREIGKPSPVSIIKRGSPILCTTALCYNARALLSAGVKWPSGRKRVSSRCYGVLPKRPIKKQLAPAWAVAWKDILSLFANMLFTFMSHMAR
ncbi:uncharacterized protein An13g01330 [Aspergillus niger]|uniref:Contig An13c0060, genomic contig n=2 Tax=Aspergillus niger TaxID=5061 RepID=A2R1I3_ASPNC|nr:uncharacterized protein An13g01330 [Aspergillus niger]CAK41533.1 unnamed protein product [Aspergillus niger]